MDNFNFGLDDNIDLFQDVVLDTGKVEVPASTDPIKEPEEKKLDTTQQAPAEEEFNFGDTPVVKKDEAEQVTPTTDLRQGLTTFIEEGKFIGVKELPETLDHESLFDLIEAESDARADATIDDLMESFGEVGTGFLKFTKLGGKPVDFLAEFNNKPIVSKLPFETDDDKEAFLKLNYSSLEGKDSDETEGLIKFYKDSGKLNDIATKIRDKRLAEEAAKVSNLVEQAKQDKAARLTQQQQYKDSVSKLVTDNTEILGLSITPAEKKKLVSFVTDYAFINKKDNKELTSFDVELQKALTDPNKKVFIAKMLMNNFNLDGLKTKAKNEIVTTMQKQAESGLKTAVNNQVTKSSILSILDNNF